VSDAREDTPIDDEAEDVLELPPEALEALPIFPLPGTVLLPETLIPLHVFEPRYRRMIADALDGHRAIALALLDEGGAPDAFGRPPVHGVAGVGVVRRSARLPDGRYNILLEGVLRADISDELPPSASIPYRRVRARAIAEVEPSVPREDFVREAHALRALCLQLASEVGQSDTELVERISEIEDPAALVDAIAARTLTEIADRQRVLAEPDVAKRLRITSGALGAVMLKTVTARRSEPPGWGMGQGQA
jgi:Lon protease-like protein